MIISKVIFVLVCHYLLNFNNVLSQECQVSSNALDPNTCEGFCYFNANSNDCSASCAIVSNSTAYSSWNAYNDGEARLLDILRSRNYEFGPNIAYNGNEITWGLRKIDPSAEGIRSQLSAEFEASLNSMTEFSIELWVNQVSSHSTNTVHPYFRITNAIAVQIDNGDYEQVNTVTFADNPTQVGFSTSPGNIGNSAGTQVGVMHYLTTYQLDQPILQLETFINGEFVDLTVYGNTGPLSLDSPPNDIYFLDSPFTVDPTDTVLYSATLYSDIFDATEAQTLYSEGYEKGKLSPTGSGKCVRLDFEGTVDPELVLPDNTPFELEPWMIFSGIIVLFFIVSGIFVAIYSKSISSKKSKEIVPTKDNHPNGGSNTKAINNVPLITSNSKHQRSGSRARKESMTAAKKGSKRLVAAEKLAAQKAAAITVGPAIAIAGQEEEKETEYESGRKGSKSKVKRGRSGSGGGKKSPKKRRPSNASKQKTKKSKGSPQGSPKRKQSSGKGSPQGSPKRKASGGGGDVDGKGDVDRLSGVTKITKASEASELLSRINIELD